jgi:hypothetical protein
MSTATSPSVARSGVAKRLVPALILSLTMILPTASAAGVSTQTGRNPAVITTWNQIAVATIPVNPAAYLNYSFVHLAMYNAVNGITREYELYKWQSKGPREASPEAAAAAAAHRILVTYFPAATTTLNDALEDSLAGIPDGSRENQGVGYGVRAADRIIALRANDGRGAAVVVPPATEAGDWSPTPPANAPFAVPWLGQVKPLALRSLTRFDPGPPPAIGTARYRAELEEVRLYGGAAGTPGLLRTDPQTATAQFINAIPFGPMQAGLRDFATRDRLDISESARLFAAVNVSVADALGTVWNGKLKYMWWRPITAIHEADDGVPFDDGDSLTIADTTWLPLINTPPYPDWPSGLCAVVGGVTQTLKRLTGDVDLFLASPVETRHYTSRSQLNREAVDARVWSGIHFRTADEVSITIGTRTANDVLDRYFGRD